MFAHEDNSNSTPGAKPPVKPKAITRWNILALACGVIGTAVTLTVDQLWLRSWMESGKAFPIGQRCSVELHKGQSLVYYESPVGVPVGDVILYMLDPDGNRVLARAPETDISYRLWLNGWSGRALWKLDLPRDGTYTFRCFNDNFERESDMPIDDRIVFAKTPDSLAHVSLVRTLIQVTGATMTMTLVIVFYVLHGLSLRKAATT
jgi:hypothetical protein